MKRISFFSVLFILFLASCRVGRPYERPDVKLPQNFSATSTDTASIADIEWRQFFTDTHLQALIDKALNHNQDLLLAVKRIDISLRQLEQSRALTLPEVNASLNGQFNRPSNNSLNGVSSKSFLGQSHIENYNALITASWEIDVWGRIRAQKEIALNNYLQSYEGARAVQTQLVAQVAQGYYNLVMWDQQLLIARRNLLLSDSFVRATRMLKDAGLSNALAVQQAEAQQQATAMLIPNIEQNISLQENALQLLLGELPGKVERAGSLREAVVPQSYKAGLPAALLSRRPDVRVAELALATANAQVGIANANRYPAVNITAGAGLESFKWNNWFNIPGSLFGLAAGSIVQPVFARKALRTRYETAKVEREMAALQFQQSVLRSVTEVSNALVQIEKGGEMEKLAAQQAATLQTAVFNAQSLFKSDMASYLEVISAQSNALQVQLNLVSVQRQRWNAIVELYRALGGGWK